MRKAGLVWKTFICSLEAHQLVQQPWGGVWVAWVPDTCLNPISPGLEPASALRGYKDLWRERLN